MKIVSAEFLISNSDFKKCPKIREPEYAFIGRSNVGKSSLINMLLGRNKLAKVSSKPGKTQLINHFKVNEGTWYLVDLPGYGWAKVSKSLRSEWEPMTKGYLTTRENLACVFVLIDCRIPPQQIDLDFIDQLGEYGIPFIIVFTKADKLTKNKVQSGVAAFMKALKQRWEELPQYIITSSEAKTGRDELLDFIGDINESIKS
ncbi:ribosome biogenesis GTP-binding protein YihA/YsxC [Aureibacter tunicatorum]|uniref:Probable GTP-binding protein EngB n=1 Tax=Aureibacter tunicatorum TaxID=866807 RepID=A0AAE4BSV9_9BACT|nr:ribosome biogenesis GTP-binding protein YihA/YsxC [Aureibacter tunicatorum]MDR6240176.1 GTP-binding protein [Aureibacter tunicatorum]BDD05943.1 putative GTP-binding protein EngB [Aureibacter tunicatorum]